jgi:predicted AAA+ superfamily ATPase
MVAGMDRYLRRHVVADLARKMVFLGGPRQVGKTYLAKKILGRSQSGYLSWDVPAQRQSILRRELPASRLVVFDELHKFRGWRNYLKGVFDEFHPRTRILVTGSARLDLYRFGGDSLQGRYYFVRLHPFSLAELGGSAKDFAALLELGGFPEPLLGGSAARARRWSIEYRERLVREDVSAVENIQNLGALELLILRLPELVGSPLSINALREDLQLNHQTVSRWLDVLERMYAIFRVAPFGAPKIRAVKKERKHYHVDWSLVRDESSRFENMVASHLLKWVDFQRDTEGRLLELRYFRDVDGREVDFVVVEGRRPVMMVECKLRDQDPAPALRYLSQRFPSVPAYQVSAFGTKDVEVSRAIRLMPARRLLAELV